MAYTCRQYREYRRISTWKTNNNIIYSTSYTSAGINAQVEYSSNIVYTGTSVNLINWKFASFLYIKKLNGVHNPSTI